MRRLSDRREAAGAAVLSARLMMMSSEKFEPPFWSFHDSWYDAHKMTHSTYTLLLPRHKRSLSSPPFPPTPQPAQDAVKASWKSRGMSLSPHLPLERTVLPEAVRMASRSRAPCHIRFVSLFFLLATCPTP